MRKSVLRKIQRVYQYWVNYSTQGGAKRCGPYWRGEYREKGRSISVYIGKELPDSLGYLLHGRYKRPGYNQYTWPGRKEGGDKNNRTKQKGEGSKEKAGRVKAAKGATV